MDFTAPLREKFKEAAGEAALFELKLRMLCEAVPSLERLAHTNQIADAEQAVAAHFAKHLSIDETSLLQLARQLRNKLLHGDFRDAREKLRAAGETPGTTGVRLFAIDSEGDVGAQVSDLAASGFQGGQRVADTASTREGTVYGWLIELGGSGDFDLAIKTFRRAGTVLERLVKINAGVSA